MLQASKLVPQGRGLAPVLVRRAATLTLDWDLRQKSRFDAETSDGRRVGVFLPRGSVVRGGDVLVTQDGSLLRVVAAPQPVLRITACSAHDHGHAHDPAFDLMRAAYHLGNRHVPIELRPDHLKIEPDHVLADLLRAMHLEVAEVNEAFEPEAGAYGQGHGGHGHGSAHSHSHGHAHDHAPHPGHDHGHRHHGHSHG
ncbi:MAG TPA: urease accessory protein UreE [Hydrogenophaga sp.]|uniref:urease accessory protein UreE n=1 Tax=Hydrogenophaga sp. TaxID=1904254 RepID=UPI002C6E46EC|nr:urease accessory protein UreE [Hydrogenophaga sp.]HMN92695.1 urease accessory protein UreE [Hydrogenophaga sp.]HMP08853.1 urease accessory protein UreE [Hydrogenophaga sp.]